MNTDLLYRIALTRIPHIGDILAQSLIRYFESAENVLKASHRKLENTEGVGTVRARSIKQFRDFTSCEKEINFLEKNNIRTYCVVDHDYPEKLRHCADAPLLIYFKGKSESLHQKMVSVVGTRNYTAYGKECCEHFIRELQENDITIVSGLAYGIDTFAHQFALEYGLPTLGVLAHGLDSIYPYTNKSLAKAICNTGGLLTEFTSGTPPDKQNFPRRNRITAGICDALVVIETGKRGGSLITAELANQYHKDVFAFPGRVNDTKSEGCNNLIKTNKAHLISSATDMLHIMGWSPEPVKSKPIQTTLLIHLSEDEQLTFQLIQQQAPCHIDLIRLHTGLFNSRLASVLLSLEMQGLVRSLPGMRYETAH